jgi:hypothetical protein
MIALSKVWRRSFGTLRLTSPALVCSVRWKLQKEWKSNLDTPGVIQLSYMKNLFASTHGNNSSGDGDWVLVLEASTAR